MKEIYDEQIKIESKYSLCYNSKQGVEVTVMSVVGIIECKDGVVGFSDSKNHQSLKDENIQKKSFHK